MVITIITTQKYQQAENYANAINTSWYGTNCGQNDNTKRWKDQLIGKIGELAAYDIITLHYPKFIISPPDFTIYLPGSKSYAADLFPWFHVKSVEKSIYEPSWCFNIDDPIVDGRDIDGYVVFCVVDGYEVDIKKIVKVITLQDKGAFKLPAIKKYRDTKRAVYWNNIKDYK